MPLSSSSTSALPKKPIAATNEALVIAAMNCIMTGSGGSLVMNHTNTQPPMNSVMQSRTNITKV